MTLSDIFMPLPAGGRRGEGRSPMGVWERADETEEAIERRRAAWRKYANANPDKRRASVRAWRARQKAEG